MDLTNSAAFTRSGIGSWLARSLIGAYPGRFILLSTGVPQRHLRGELPASWDSFRVEQGDPFRPRR